MAKRKRVMLALLLGLAAVASLAVYLWGFDEYRIWSWDLADIDADVRDALSRNDARFRAYSRYSMTVPGVSGEDSLGNGLERWNLVRKQGWVFMPGISCTSGFGRYFKSARAYAEKYNRRLLRELGISSERGRAEAAPRAEPPAPETGCSDGSAVSRWNWISPRNPDGRSWARSREPAAVRTRIPSEAQDPDRTP